METLPSAATGAPTISGTARVGETLTAVTTGIADGLDNVDFQYQWVASDGSTDADISGATASAYTLAATDLGKTVKVRVSFIDDAGNPEMLTSAATATVAARPNSPATEEARANTADTGGSNTAGTGGSNTAGTGGSNTPGTGGSNTPGTGGANTPGTGGSNTPGTGGSNTPGTGGANTPATGAPAITGTARVGETLTAATTGIGDTDGLNNVDFQYQWVANDGSTDADISGATGSAYTLAATDLGKTVKVRVSFIDDAGNPETLTSAVTATVAPRPNTPATGAPAITGAAQVNETLTAATTGIGDADGLNNVDFQYQWVANDGSTGADISGATGRSYTLTATDLGKTVKVRVSFTDDAGNPETLTSAATTTVALAQDGGEGAFNFDFDNGAEGWTVGFADLPVDYNQSIYELDHGHRQLPDGLEGGGVYIQGHNRSDDLFMYLKKRVGGLRPNTTYAISVSVDLATNVPAGSIGIGGSPGESVYVKAGASTVEPLAEEDSNRYLRMNIDKGNQARGGESMVVLGNVANFEVANREYRVKTLDNADMPLSVTTDDEGGVWLIVGTDSGFEGLSRLYYARIAYTLIPVELPRTGGYAPPVWALALIAGFGAALAGLGLVGLRPQR